MNDARRIISFQPGAQLTLQVVAKPKSPNGITTRRDIHVDVEEPLGLSDEDDTPIVFTESPSKPDTYNTGAPPTSSLWTSFSHFTGF